MEKFITLGVCAREIFLDVDSNGIVTDIKFVGGCNGNTKGLEVLVKGLHKDEIIKKLKGITCGARETSCPDQLAKALLEL